jgi:hypothetical protein
LAAARHWSSWASHCWVPPASWPALAALAQAFFWMAHERWMAAPAFWKVAPLTAKGRSAPAVLWTGGGGPPRAPVKA